MVTRVQFLVVIVKELIVGKYLIYFISFLDEHGTAVTLSILEALALNFGLYTGYPDLCFSSFSSVFRDKCRYRISIRPSALSSYSFSVHQ
jgi:hypothetical protein